MLLALNYFARQFLFKLKVLFTSKWGLLVGFVMIIDLSFKFAIR